MDQAALHKILSRYIAGECPDEERRLVEYWYELLGEQIDLTLTEQEWQAIGERIWQQLHSEENKVVLTESTRPLWRRKVLVAASLAALAIIFFGTKWYSERSAAIPSGALILGQKEPGEWVRHTNQESASRIIRLPDSSLVTLEQGAELLVSKKFNQSNREVSLTGEAAFSVERNTELPFIVYSGGMATKVLGTRFRIRAIEPGKPVEVDVQSGKVTVYRPAPAAGTATRGNNGLILTPNQKATYFPENEQFVAGLTEYPEPVKVLPPAKKPGAAPFVYEEVPISEILRQLEEIYGTDIELEQESLGKCPFTGNLSQQSLFTKLELLCGAINGAYMIRGTKILVTGRGCYE